MKRTQARRPEDPHDRDFALALALVLASACAGAPESALSIPLDYDRDGLPDRLVSDGGTLRLLKSDRGDRSRDVTALAGLAGVPVAGPAAVALLDVDRNGWPDFFVAAGPGAGPNRLFVNQANGLFAEEAVGRGVAEPAATGAAWARDADGDGDVDLGIGGAVFFRFDGVGGFQQADPAQAVH